MIRDLEEAAQVLLTYAASPHPVGGYTLKKMRSLLAQLGNPQNSLRVIHIAGTSGKTSTAYFIRGLLQAVGKRTGLTISPHITKISERVQINGQPLSDDQFVAYLSDFLPLVAKTNLQPSYFEILIAFAFWVFAKEKVDYAVIETGLGGLLDATNTVDRTDKLCVLTDIGLDHTEILGDTLALIAAQKAGIIQPHNIVVTNKQIPDVIDVFRAETARKHAHLHMAKIVKNTELSPFQERNWSLALAAYAQLGLPTLTTDQLAQVSTQTPPGRMEIYTYNEKTIVLDGAHNAQKIAALHTALRARGVTKAAVLANLTQAPATKVVSALTELKPFTARLIVPEFATGQDFYGRRSFAPADFAAAAQTTGITNVSAEPNLSEALKKLLESPEATLVITGSLYLVSAIRPLIQKIALSGRSAV